MFSYGETINIFMEGRNCWPMQISCSVFVTTIEKESQVFYYRFLKRINFLFKTLASPFSPGWVIIKECAFLPGTCNNIRSVFWNSFTWKGFSETKQATSVIEFIINRWTILIRLIKIFSPVAAAPVPWQRGLRILGTMVRYSKRVHLGLADQERNTFLF